MRAAHIICGATVAAACVLAAASGANSGSRAALAFVVIDRGEQLRSYISVVAPDGTGRRRLVEGGDIAWSPDGERFAFTRWTTPAGGRDVYLAGADGTGVSLLVGAAADEMNPVWSPDGRGIAYMEHTAETWTFAPMRLRVVDVATRVSWTVASDAFFQDSAAWSPDGIQLIYSALRRPEPYLVGSDLVLAAADGSGETRALTTTTWDERGPINERAPRWAPDGRSIAFIRRPGNPNYPGELWVMRADGTGERRLIDRSGGFSWSPDSERIVSLRDPTTGCSRSCDSARPLMVVTVASGQSRIVTSTAVEGLPAWSPDGAKIAFPSHRDDVGELYVMNADGTCETRLTNTGTVDRSVSAVAWQPGRSSGPRLRCRDIDVTGINLPNPRERTYINLGGRVTYRVNVRSIGNLAATNVRFDVRSSRLLDVITATMTGTICKTRPTVVCRVARMRPGETRAVEFSVRANFAAVDTHVGTSDRALLAERIFINVSAAGESNVGNNALDVRQLIVPCSIEGSNKSERLRGTEARDRICAREGDDAVLASGDDVIDAGVGADTVDPGKGLDLVRGRGGDDRILAADGQRDVIACGAGTDRVTADRVDRLIDCELVSIR